MFPEDLHMAFEKENNADRRLDELLVSRRSQPEDTIIEIPLPRGEGTVKIGDGSLSVMAGPCTLENEQQVMTTAKAAGQAGAVFLEAAPSNHGHLHMIFPGLDRRVWSF